MSHYVDIKTLIKDPKALIRALGRLGMKAEHYENSQNLNGFFGSRAQQKANVIVRRGTYGLHADMGFEKVADGTFSMRADDYDTMAQHGGKYGTEWQSKLNTWYGVEKAKMEFEHRGMKYFEDMDDQQRPRIKVKI